MAEKQASIDCPAPAVAQTTVLPAWATREVPRYTSYPTAPHFTAAVGPDHHAAWLSALSPDATLSLYLHVPFCSTLCLYCGCNTKIVHRHDPIERYTGILLKEIERVATLSGRRRVLHLHWGGGTPTMLGADGFDRVMEHLSRFFDLSGLREHAIEIDPRRLTRPLAAALVGIGVNRASLGVQDFTARVQRAIGRIQPLDVVARAAGLLRDAGIGNLSIDLMYGLPEQDAADVARSAGLASSLEPGRIALFGYAHVPWFKKHQRLIEEGNLPGPQARLAQARVAARTLTELGYRAIGFDHFADPRDELALAAERGTLRRNFQGYTVDDADALLGFGASAISRIPQGFVQNAPDIAGHARAITAGRTAAAKGVALTSDDRLRWAIIERLLCGLVVDLDAVAPGQSFEDEMAALVPFVDADMVRIEDRRIAIAESGRSFLRVIASAFDAYLPANRARHSLAV